MKLPDDFDAELRDLLATTEADAELRAEAANFMAPLHGGSQAILIAQDEAGKVQYYVMNIARAAALGLMARLSASFAEKLTSDINES